VNRSYCFLWYQIVKDEKEIKILFYVIANLQCFMFRERMKHEFSLFNLIPLCRIDSCRCLSVISRFRFSILSCNKNQKYNTYKVSFFSFPLFSQQLHDGSCCEGVCFATSI
jgi:hypothetical protein